MFSATVSELRMILCRFWEVSRMFLIFRSFSSRRDENIFYVVVSI